MTEYTIAKDGRRWSVLRVGVKAGSTHARKRDAAEYIMELRASDAYKRHCSADDASGVYRWTPADELEIATLAIALRNNLLQWTFAGRQQFQDIARDAHKRDAKDLANNAWTDPQSYHMQLRRRMAARVEAFKRAGVEL